MATNVIYYSRKGHTKAVAETVAKVADVEAIDITKPHSLGETDLLFIGTGIYAGRPDQVLLDYVDNLPTNMIKGAAIFSTSAAGKDRTEMLVNLLEHKGIVVYPKHLCIRGQFLFFALNHPNLKDMKKANQFTQEVLDSFQG